MIRAPGGVSGGEPGRYEEDVQEPATQAIGRRAARQILIGFGLALVAQLFLSRHSAIEGLVLYVLALGLVWRGLHSGSAGDAVAAGSPPLAWVPEPRRRWRRQARLAIGFLVPLAFLGFGGNRITVGGMLTLLGAIGAYLYVFWAPSGWRLPAASWWPGRGGLRIRISSTALVLIAIFALGMVFRFYRLTDVPSDMTSDHAEKYLDIRDIHEGVRPIFFARNSGREGTEFYLASLLTGLTGYTFLTLKLVMCAASMAELPFVYLLGREVGGKRAGLIATFLIAISKWDVAVARSAIRASFASLYCAIALYLLYRALQRRELNTFLVLGAILGLGLYGYTSFRVVLVFVLIAIGALVWLNPELRGHRRIIVRQTLIAYGMTGLIALPLLRYAFDFPQQFLLRSVTRLTGSEQALPGEPIAIFAGNVWNGLLMFNWSGDRSWITQVPQEPALDWVTGALFAVGVTVALYRGWRLREPTLATLLSGLFVLTLPSTLALAFPIENPHLSRANPVIPVVMVVAAVGFDHVIRAAEAILRSAPGRWATAGVAVALAAGASLANYQSYFNDFAAGYRLNTQNEREIAAVVRGYTALTGSDQSAYVAAWPYWVDFRIVALELGDFAWKDHALIDPIENASTQAGQTGPKLYILHHDDVHGLSVLRSLFPQGIVQEHSSAKPGKAFRAFLVPG